MQEAKPSASTSSDELMCFSFFCLVCTGLTHREQSRQPIELKAIADDWHIVADEDGTL